MRINYSFKKVSLPGGMVEMRAASKICPQWPRPAKKFLNLQSVQGLVKTKRKKDAHAVWPLNAGEGA